MPVTYSDSVKPHSLQVPSPCFSVKTILTLAIKCDLAKMVNKLCGNFPLVCRRNFEKIYSSFKYFITPALGFLFQLPKIMVQWPRIAIKGAKSLSLCKILDSFKILFW